MVEATKKTEQLIVQHLKVNGQKMSWLAGKINLSNGHLHSVLKGKKNVKRQLTAENLQRINEVLGTQF